MSTTPGGGMIPFEAGACIVEAARFLSRGTRRSWPRMCTRATTLARLQALPLKSFESFAALHNKHHALAEAEAKVKQLTAQLADMKLDHEVALSRLEGELKYRNTQSSAAASGLQKQLQEADEEVKKLRRANDIEMARSRDLTSQVRDGGERRKGGAWQGCGTAGRWWGGGTGGVIACSQEVVPGAVGGLTCL